MKKTKAPLTVSRLEEGTKFETEDGIQYKLLYCVGDMRAYVQILTVTHVKLPDGAEFDRPGAKVNISTGTVVSKILS